MNQQSASVHPINESVNIKQPLLSQQPTKLPTSKPTESLPSRKLSFDRHLILLRAYATAYTHFNRAVGVKEVSEISRLTPDTISTANAFFLDNGLVQKQDSKFIPSDELLAFNHAYQWNPESAPTKLAPLLLNTWFAKRLLPKLLMGNILESEAITELASACSAPPTYRAHIRTLIDFLNEVGIVRRQGDLIMKGNLSASSDVQEIPPATEHVEKPSPALPNPHIEQTREPQRSAMPPMNPMNAGTVQFNISVKVDIAEFAGWDAQRISSFFNGIAQVLAAKAAVE